MSKEEKNKKQREYRAKIAAEMSPEEKEKKNKKQQEYRAKKGKAKINKEKQEYRAKMSLEAKEKKNKNQQEYRAKEGKAKINEEQQEYRTKMATSETETRVNFSNTLPHHRVEMEPGEGVDRHLKDHHNCPKANAFLNHLCTYRNHFIGDPNNPREREILKEQIRSQYVTPDQQRDTVLQFLASQGRGCKWAEEGSHHQEYVKGKSRDAPVYTCAACGVRNIDTTDGNLLFERVRLDELDYFELSAEEKKRHSERIESKHLLMSNGTKLELWRAWSIWPQEKLDPCGNKKYYHLHPEFIEPPDDPRDEDFYHNWARLCQQCSKFKGREDCNDSDKPPPLSLKAGVDFGSYHRIGLPSLSLMERHIVSKFRHYSQVVKIESNSGRQKDHTQCCIKGCCIAFDHDSPSVMANLLSKESLVGDIGIHFVGPEGTHDTLLRKTRTLKPAHLFARPTVTYLWLQTLKAIHPLYENEPELPPYEEFKQRLEESIEELLASSLSTSDADAIQRTNIARDDVAGIRHTSQQDHGGTDSNGPNTHVESAGGNLSLRYTYLTYRDKTEFDSHSDTKHEFLRGAANKFGVNVELEREEYKVSQSKRCSTAGVNEFAQSRRSANPVNEFSDEGNDALFGGWPDIFLLGGGNFGRRGSLSEKETKHLLMQFTASAASCQLLLFYLFDKMQRHGTVQQLAARIKQNPKAFDEFTKTFTSSSFQKHLQKAVANPDSPQAKKVMNKLIPVMTSGSKSVTFSALQRRSTAGEILAMGRKYGPASTFLTVSVDDVNSPGVLRMAHRSCNNLNFPAMSPDELLKAMELGEDHTYENESNCIHCQNGQRCSIGHSGEVRIPCGWEHLARSATENPVSVALHYKKLIYNLLTILVGIKPGTTSGDGKRTTKTFYRGWGKNGMGIIVGTPVAYLGVTETTAKGSLHFHVGTYNI